MIHFSAPRIGHATRIHGENRQHTRLFYLALGRHPRNAIPNGIGGDFVKFTAPNDPLFFLHHTHISLLMSHHTSSVEIHFLFLGAHVMTYDLGE